MVRQVPVQHMQVMQISQRIQLKKLTLRPCLFVYIKRRWNKVHRISIISKKWFTNLSVRDWRRGQGSTCHLLNSQGAARKFHWQRHLPWGTRLPLMRSWKSKSKHIPVSFFCHTFVYAASNIFSSPPHTGRSWLISVYSAHLMAVIWSLLLLMIKMEILLFLISLCTVFVMMMLSIRKIHWDIGYFSRPGSLWVFIWLPLHSPLATLHASFLFFKFMLSCCVTNDICRPIQCLFVVCTWRMVKLRLKSSLSSKSAWNVKLCTTMI